MRVLAAVPCLDEEVAIGSVVLRAKAHAEVLVIDDGSTDGTTKVAKLAGARVVRHPKNKGKGAAYATLWKEAVEGGYDALVVLDGDGQHDPDEIPLVLAGLKDADLVIGARWGERTQMPLWRKAGKRVLDYATALGSGKGPKVTDSQSGFRAYNRRALETLRPAQAGFAVESQLLMDAHKKELRIGEVPIHCRYDVEGSSQGAVRHASGVLNEVLVQVGLRHPLLLLGLPGFLLVIAGVATAAYALVLRDTSGTLSLPLLLAALGALIAGAMAGFAALVFHLLPRIIQANRQA